MERHFDEELKGLKEKLLEMASLAKESIRRSIKALVDKDEKLAKVIINSDDAINMLEIEINELCLKLLALRQPMAGDLRFVASAMKINSDLERIGDLSVNIAQRTLDLLKEAFLKPLIDIPRMAELSQEMVSDSLEAFVKRDVALARNVCKRDDKVDELNEQIFRELITYMFQSPKNIARSIDLVLIARHLERIADHATNIAEEVVFIAKGKTIKHHIEDKEFKEMISSFLL